MTRGRGDGPAGRDRNRNQLKIARGLCVVSIILSLETKMPFLNHQVTNNERLGVESKQLTGIKTFEAGSSATGCSATL